MHGIHTFSTAPFRYGRDVWGGAAKQDMNFSLPEYLFITLVLSALQWRKTNGPITLFTDDILYRFLEERGALGCWDNISLELNNLDEELQGIDHAVYWAASKFYCYTKMVVPFVCIDTDLIMMKTLQIKPGTDLLVSHYESVEEGDSNYIELKNLAMRRRYHFYSTAKVSLGVNMSTCGFFNQNLRDRFVYEAMRVMKNSTASYDGKSYALPEMLYMEQILPVQIALQERYKIEALIDCVWSPKNFCFTKDDPKLGGWRFNVLDECFPCMHLWFHKNYIETNEKAREEYVLALKQFFKKSFPEEYESIVDKVGRSDSVREVLVKILFDSI